MTTFVRGMPFADDFAQLQTVHERHLDVRNQHIGPGCLQQRQRDFAVWRLAAQLESVCAPIDVVPNSLSGNDLIFDEEDLVRHAVKSPPPGSVRRRTQGRATAAHRFAGQAAKRIGVRSSRYGPIACRPSGRPAREADRKGRRRLAAQRRQRRVNQLVLVRDLLAIDLDHQHRPVLRRRPRQVDVRKRRAQDDRREQYVPFAEKRAIRRAIRLTLLRASSSSRRHRPDAAHTGRTPLVGSLTRGVRAPVAGAPRVTGARTVTADQHGPVQRMVRAQVAKAATARPPPTLAPAAESRLGERLQRRQDLAADRAASPVAA